MSQWRRLGLLATLLLIAGPGRATPALGAAKPSLVVLIVVDQLGASYMSRYGEHLTRGLRKLERMGAYYPNGVHAIANTATGPGHANIATGAWPNVHGITSNRWCDAGVGEQIYCAQDPRHRLGPAQLVAPTIGDVLELATAGRSKTVSVALKDRAAILLGGHKPDLAIWYDETVGQFVSADYDHRASPAWLTNINLEQSAAPVFGKTWTRVRPDLDYAAIAGPDDVREEEDIPGLGRTFPHRYGAGLDAPGGEWFSAYEATPASIDAVVSLALHAIDEEALGKDATPDLLTIGISTLDIVGHGFGTEAQETFDTLIRIDIAVETIIRHVEEKLGSGQTVWVLTADHGIAPTPELAQSLGATGRRVAKPEIQRVVEAALAKLPGPKPTPLVRLVYGPQVFFGHFQGTTEQRRVLQRAASRALEAMPEIAEAMPPADLSSMAPQYRALFERCVYPQRSPDVFFRVQPGVVVSYEGHGVGHGSNHGSPYVYDTHVPIYIAGPRVRSGRDPRAYDITRIAPSIAALLGIEPPATAIDDPLPAVTP